MSEKIKLSLIVRYLSGECTEVEKKLVQNRMQKDGALRNSISEMQKVWNVREKPLFQEDTDIAWQRMKSRIEFPPREEKEKVSERFSWRFTWPREFPSYAFPAKRLLRFAVVFLVICGSFLIFKNFLKSTKAPQDRYKVVTVDNGHRIDMNLNDGTHIILDAGSELKYPTEFRDARDVYLKGEAYFEVTYDPKRPFRVHANHALIRVLGTKFNIRAWNENPTVFVTVTKGKVALSRSDGTNQKTVVISKGHYSSLTQKGLPSTPIQVDVGQHLGWMNNEIDFQDASVKEVLAQLERWYEFQFDIIDNSLLEQRITVHIRKTNITDVLELISILTDTNITKEGRMIKIRSKN